MHGWTRYILAVCLLAGPAQAEDEASAIPGNHVTERDRQWANFTRESAMVGSGELRLGLQTFLFNKSTNDRTPDLTGFPVDDLERALDIRAGLPDPIPGEEDDFAADRARVKTVEGTRFDLLGAYGLGPFAEIGFDMPFFSESIKFASDHPTINTGDVGDLMIFTKFRKTVATNTTVGGGLEISVPTGSERKRLGTGELAFNPFVNTRYTWNRLAVGGHIGFNMAQGSVPDVFNYSAFAIARGTDVFALRLEVVGRFFRDFGDDFNDISVWPGVDINVTDRITVRPQGLAGLTTDAWEWGIGAGVFVDLF